MGSPLASRTRRRQRLGRALGAAHETGGEDRHQHDARGKEHRQQQTRPDPGDEQVADALLGQDAVEDQEQRGRDHHAQHAGACDHPHGKARGIAVADHLRHRDLGEDRRRGDGDAGDRREDRVGPDRAHAQAAPQAAEHRIGHVEGIASQPRLGHDEPHQHEKRHHAEEIAGNRVIRRQRHQLRRQERRALDRPDPDEGADHQRNGHEQPRQHGHEHRRQRDQADLEWGQCAPSPSDGRRATRPSGAGCARRIAGSAWCRPQGSSVSPAMWGR